MINSPWEIKKKCTFFCLGPFCIQVLESSEGKVESVETKKILLVNAYCVEYTALLSS